jgi:hypothetical protein
MIVTPSITSDIRIPSASSEYSSRGGLLLPDIFNLAS